jgi:hypothetical protein
MTLEQVFFASQSISAVGVMASLIFVGLEVRNNSKAVRSGTAQRVHENYADWYLALASSSSALATSVKGLTNMGALSSDEKAAFICVMTAYTSHAQNAFHQWRDGHLTIEQWSCWKALLYTIVHTAGGAAFWAERAYIFSKEFQDAVTIIMSQQPNPLSKGFGVVPVSVNLAHRHAAQPAPGAD